mgnify:CR=1 FL=1
MSIFLNILILINIIIFIFYRFRKYKIIQLTDFLLIMFALFFPLSLIRPFLGYESIIGYEIFEHTYLLEMCTIMTFLGLFLFFLGYFMDSLSYKIKRKVFLVERQYNYSKTYIKLVKKVNLFFIGLSLLTMYSFVKSQGNILSYFSNIDSMRATLQGQMINYGLLYLNSLISIYLILITKKNTWVSKLGVLISILLFAIYGFRGPVLSILIILFFTLQKLNIFKIKFTFKSLLVFGLILFLYVYSQDIRESNRESEPFLLKILTRFNGYEPLMVIYDKVILKDFFSLSTVYYNFLSFIQLPIPRSLFPSKVEPVSLILSERIFYDIGYREFNTGGVSPTIIGSLLWNFSFIGLFLMLLLGKISSYIENRIRLNNSPIKIVFYLCMSIFLILSIEFPENSFGVLWLLMLSFLCIRFINKFKS